MPFKVQEAKLLVKSHPFRWRGCPGTSYVTSLMVSTVFLVNIGLKKFPGTYRAFGCGILFPKLYWPTVKKKSKKTFQIWGWRPRILIFFFFFFFLNTRTIYSNSWRTVQFLQQIAFSTCSWQFLRSNTFRNSNLEKNNI